MRIEQSAAKNGKGVGIYIYINTFHGTSTWSMRSPRELEAVSYRIFSGTASEEDLALRRSLHACLCGVPGCACGDEFGRRSGY